MAALATTGVTSNAPASSVSGSTSAPANGDVFAAMLDQLAQELTGAPADAAADDDAGTQTDTTTPDPASSDANATTPALDPMLAQLLAQQAVAGTPAPDANSPKPAVKSNDTGKGDPSGSAVADAAPAPVPVMPPADLPPDASDGSSMKADSGKGGNAVDVSLKADPGQPDKPRADAPVSAADVLVKADASPRAAVAHDPDLRSVDRGSSKAHRAARGEAASSDDSSRSNPVLDASTPIPTDSRPAPATVPAVPGTPADPPSTPVSAQPSDPARTDAIAATQPSDPARTDAIAAAQPMDPVRADAVQPADPSSNEAVASATPAMNQAASAVVANGTITKPGKSAAGVVSNDSNKSQSRNTRAAALADAGDVSRRGFASELVTRTNAVNDKPDDVPASNGTSAQPQHSAANPATAATPAQRPDPAPVQQVAATPVAAISRPAAQPDPGVNIATVNTGASPTQTPATPAHLAAQIQVSQHTPDVNALAVTIAAKSQDGQKHFDIRLDPAELGRVDVRLTVDDAGKAQAMLSVEKPQTLELLQKDQAHLERALKDAGLDLAQNGLNFSLKGQQQQAMPDHTPFARGQRLAASVVASIDDVPPILSTSGVSASDTRLDIRV